MEQQVQHNLLLRFCECKPGEVLEDEEAELHSAAGAHFQPVKIGTAVMTKWDPTHPHRICVLYSSGILRLWDVVSDSKRDFALYLPLAGIPTGDGDHTHIPDRRLATPMTFFDFIPFHIPGKSKDLALPRIAFTVRKGRTLHIADIPAQKAASANSGDHYLTGSRVYECTSQLSEEASALSAWLIVPHPIAMAAVAVGCRDGSLAVWLLSGAFNPAAIVSMRSNREASPAFIRAVKESPGATSVSLGGNSQPVALTAAAHNGRVRCIKPLIFTTWTDDDNGFERAALAADHSVRTSHHAFMKAASAVVAHLTFTTSGDDGLVRMWRIQICLAEKPVSPHFLLKPRDDVSDPAFDVKLMRCSDVPVDGVKVTAMVSESWPLSVSPHSAAVLEAVRFMSGRKADHDSQRSLFITGNCEGVVHVWEVLTNDAYLRIGSGAYDVDQAPAVRLVGMVAAPTGESISDIGLTAQSHTSTQFAMVVADVDGVLRTYSIRSTSDALIDEHSAGSAGPLTIHLLGSVETGLPSASISDVISSLHPHAQAIHALQVYAHTSDASTASNPAPPLPRLTTALTAVALQRLRTSIISCCFNASSRFYPTASPALVNALLACNGAGDIMLWKQHELPGCPLPALRGDNKHHQDSKDGASTPSTPVADDANSAGEEEYKISEASSSPRLEAAATHNTANDDAKESDDNDADKDDDKDDAYDDDEEEVPPIIHVPEPIAADNEHDDNAGHPHPLYVHVSPNDTAGVRHSRVLQDTASRVHYRASISTPKTPSQRSGRSPSVTQSQQFLRQAASDAVRAAYQPHTNDKEGSGLHVAQHLHIPHAALHGPVERWAIRASQNAARSFGLDARDIEGCAPPSSRGGARNAADKGDSVGSRSRSPSLTNAVPYKNPAKVAATLVKDAKETARAVLLTGSSTVDTHPDAAGVYERVAVRGPENHHHLVAPAVGSSRAIAKAIQDIESMRFDPMAALETILQRRNVTDPTIREDIIRRLNGASTDAENCAPEDHDGTQTSTDGDYVYVPSKSKPGPAVTGKKAQAKDVPSRVLSPTIASSSHKNPATTGHVTAVDVISWHQKLR